MAEPGLKSPENAGAKTIASDCEASQTTDDHQRDGWATTVLI